MHLSSLVDDVKYADAKLYQLLSSLPQSSDNLHPVLNKVDLLQVRYPGTWESVVESMLEDVAAKLAKHAGLEVPTERLLALSARSALEARVGAKAGSVRSTSGSQVREAPSADRAANGDFARLVEFLESYRSDKRRLAAKELNLESRKRSFATQLRTDTLVASRRARVEGGLSLLQERRAELERSLAAIPEAVFHGVERQGLVATSLARAAPYVGFPTDVLWALWGNLPWRRRKSSAPPAEFSAERVVQHYRALLGGVDNLGKEAGLRIGDLLDLDLGSTDLERPGAGVEMHLEDMREDFQRRVSVCESRVQNRSKLWNHAAAGVVFLGYLWWAAYPTVRAAVLRWIDDDEGSFVGILEEGVYACLKLVNPVYLVATLASILLTYVATAWVTRARHVQRLERALADTEREARARVRGGVERASDALEAQVAQWLDEYDRLEETVGNVSR